MPTPELPTTPGEAESAAGSLLSLQGRLVRDHLRLTVAWTAVLAVLFGYAAAVAPHDSSFFLLFRFVTLGGRPWPLLPGLGVILLLEVATNLGIGYLLRLRTVRLRNQIEEVLREPRASTRSLLVHARLPFWLESFPVEIVLNALVGAWAVGSCALALLSVPLGPALLPVAYALLFVVLAFNGAYDLPVALAFWPIVAGLLYWVRRRSRLREVQRVALGFGPGPLGGEAAPSEVAGDAVPPLDPEGLRTQSEALQGFAADAKRRCESNELQAYIVLSAFALGVVAVAAFAVMQSSYGFSLVFQAGWYDLGLLALAGLLLAALSVRSRVKGPPSPAGLVPPPGTSDPHVGSLFDLLQDLSTTRDLLLRSRRLSQGNLMLAVLGTLWLELFLLLVFPYMAWNGQELPTLSIYWAVVPLVGLLVYLPFWGRGALAEESGRFKMASTALGVVELERRFWSRF